MVRSVGAVGTFVLGLHKKREKVPHPGLQHVLQTVYKQIVCNPLSCRIARRDCIGPLGVGAASHWPRVAGSLASVAGLSLSAGRVGRGAGLTFHRLRSAGSRVAARLLHARSRSLTPDRR